MDDNHFYSEFESCLTHDECTVDSFFDKKREVTCLMEYVFSSGDPFMLSLIRSIISFHVPYGLYTTVILDMMAMTQRRLPSLGFQLVHTPRWYAIWNLIVSVLHAPYLISLELPLHYDSMQHYSSIFCPLRRCPTWHVHFDIINWCKNGNPPKGLIWNQWWPGNWCPIH